jgi:hypothetical protein
VMMMFPLLEQLSPDVAVSVSAQWYVPVVA